MLIYRFSPSSTLWSTRIFLPRIGCKFLSYRNYLIELVQSRLRQLILINIHTTQRQVQAFLQRTQKLVFIDFKTPKAFEAPYPYLAFILQPLIIQPVRDALDYYRRLNEATQPPRHRKSTDVTAMQSTIPPPPPASASEQAESDNVCDKLPSDVPDVSQVENPAPVPTSPSIKSTGAPGASSPTELPECSITTDPPQSSVPIMGHRNSNPLSYRRASQLLMLKASGSSNSLKVAGLQPLRSTSSGTTTTFQSFPSVESESEKDGDDGCGSEDEAITEVAVSEKALKFKIATEPSFDFSTSRKGSRENKSESSGQSAGATKDDRISFDTSYASTPKVEFIGGTSHGSVSSSAHGGSSPGKHYSSKPTSSTSASSTSKAKPKDSFFSRLKLFTERLSISADSTTSGGSGCSAESPPSTIYKQQGPAFNYFRRGGRKDSKRSKSKDGSHGERYHSKHRGSSSDPEGQHTSADDKLNVDVSKDAYRGGGGGCSELVSPDCSPALSGASGIEHRRSSWKHCSGSLDSVLSKDENAKRSPSRRLMLPRFSSFVQKKTRMGFMMRRSSPKTSNSNEPQSWDEQLKDQNDYHKIHICNCFSSRYNSRLSASKCAPSNQSFT